MTKSRKRGIGFWIRAVWQFHYRWPELLLESLGVDLEEQRKARERHPVAHSIGIALVIVAVVVTVVMEFLARHH
jgi:hypothetical protein